MLFKFLLWKLRHCCGRNEDLRCGMGMKVIVAQSCPTLCDAMDYTVPGILQVRILEWVAVPFSRESAQPRGQTKVSHVAGGFLTSWAIRGAQEMQIPEWIEIKVVTEPLESLWASFVSRNSSSSWLRRLASCLKTINTITWDSSLESRCLFLKPTSTIPYYF